MNIMYWLLNFYYQLIQRFLNQNNFNLRWAQILPLHKKLEFIPMLN